MEQDLFLRAEMLKRNLEETEKRIEFIDEQISELQDFSNGLEFVNEKQEKEGLASVGKGVYVKAKMSCGEFLVDVGSGILVKKSLDETKKIVSDQVRRLGEMRQQMNSYLISFNEEFKELMRDIEKS